MLVAQLASDSLPNNLSWLSTIIRYANAINFSLDYLKPGCVVSSLTFLQMMFYTVLM